MPKPNFRITLPVSNFHVPPFATNGAQMKLAMTADIASLKAKIQEVRVNPYLAPNAQETAELIFQAIRDNKAEAKTALTELPHFDPDARVQGRTLLSLAAEARDRSFCTHLLRKGANPCHIENDILHVSGFADFLHTARVVHTMALKPQGRKGWPLIEQKLAHYEFDSARAMLESWAKDRLMESNIRGLWERACIGNRADLACAIFAFSKKEWLGRVYAETDEHGRNALHFFGLQLDHPGLDRILKKHPYYSEKFDPIESANREVEFDKSDRQIECNAIAPFAAHQILKFKRSKAEYRRALSSAEMAHAQQEQVKNPETPVGEKIRFDATLFSAEKLPAQLPLNMRHAWFKLLRKASEVRFVPFNQWNTFRSEMFRSLDEEKPWGTGEELRIKAMGVTGHQGPEEAGHVLTEIYLSAQDANGKKKYVYLLHDPNGDFPWKRVRAENLQEVEDWKSESFFKYPEDVEDYHLNKGLLICPYSEDDLETLMQGGMIEPASPAERRIINLPAGDDKFSLICEMLIGGFEGDWFDMQQELRDHVSALQEKEIFKLLGGSNSLEIKNLFMTLALGSNISGLAAYLRGLENLPITDGLKFRLVNAHGKIYDDPDASTYPDLIMADAESTQLGCDFVEKLNIPDRDKLSFVFRNGRGALRGDDPPEKARAIFNFVKKLNIPVEEKIKVAFAGSPLEGYPWSYPLIQTANTELTNVILNEFLGSLGADADTLLDALSGLPPWERQENVESADGESTSDSESSASSEADLKMVMLNGVSEEHVGKIKLMINFIANLNVSAHNKAEGMMRYDKELEDSSPLATYLKEGKSGVACEFVDGVLNSVISSDSEEDRNKKVEVLVARDKNGKPGVLHALDRGHIGTALQYAKIIRQSSSSVKEHPDMIAVLKEIDLKTGLAARGKRKASPTTLSGERRPAPSSPSERPMQGES